MIASALYSLNYDDRGINFGMQKVIDVTLKQLKSSLKKNLEKINNKNNIKDSNEAKVDNSKPWRTSPS